MTEELLYKYERVMVIDDTAEDLYITSRIVSKSNFGKNLLKYSMAGEALEYLLDNQENIEMLPGVIFVDIHMPIMTGFQFMAEYDKLSSTIKGHCKVFIISSTFDEVDIKRANSDINVTAFHEKPISKTFLEKI